MNKQNRNTNKYRHIIKSDRMEISILLNKGYGVRDIARTLNFNPGSISREIQRNEVNGEYDPDKAHQKTLVKRKKSKYQGMKIAKNVILREYVKEKLLCGWTPEQIAGRLKWLDTNLPYVSFRAIYKFLYSAHSEGFWVYLKSARYVPRRRHAPKAKREIIKNRIFIEKRPYYIEKRNTCGHFEVDRIESNKTSRAGLLVAQERKSRYYTAVKTQTRKPDENKRAILEAFYDIANVKSLTYDNDIAFAKHEEVNEELNSESFFCHPYHSWEKGGVENANKLMREYIPKGSDIKGFSKSYIRAALERLNNRPRKCLKFKTPYEIMKENYMFKAVRHSSPQVEEKTKNTASLGVALGGSM